MTGIFITARLGSTRLSNKHLIAADGITFIEWLLKRFIAEFENEISTDEVRLFITTSHKIENRKFEDLASPLKVEVFYGDDENIPLRHLQCAEQHKIDSIISIDGDDILCSTAAAREIYEMFKRDDSLKMIKTKGLPFGMNVMGYTTIFLRKSLLENTNLKLETGWGRIFNESAVTTICLNNFEDNYDLRLTLDYQDDAIFFSKVINHLGEKTCTVTDKELIFIIIENKFQLINNHLNKEYWENFNKQKNNEQ
ncbi:MAG: hypothetical protein NT150_04610 [Bacteroidetes bacterium]|nr:hypothetical protein [Bacteroidota bacterium]